ncbi:MAG: dienelactone hydrolase family protein [Deltaproteobacteria bacterium]|nr:dienelactone hydrolase family protein [Deltaproteobacteria bacterium]MBW2256952.1 dienelactone hydrolase family protein [Deltaproteobacteria bacterium]
MHIWHGPKASPHLFVLAPGDAGRLTDSAPLEIAEGLGRAGVRVIRFAFPPCDEDGAVRDALLATEIRQAAACREPHQHLVLGGLSRGARVGAMLAQELGAIGLVGFAYPFHARHDPDPAERVTQLAQVNVPVLIFQGTRDSHGNREQVRGYRLPDHVRVHWLEDANHALHPRSRSGHTQASQLAEAAAMAAAFIRAIG